MHDRKADGPCRTCSIPTCLYTLDLTSRLFPEDANFSVIRRLLHRLLTQCDDQLRALTGTCRELARARVTRDAVIALDRYAFEISGESDPEPAQAEESLFGEDLSGSLSAVSLSVLPCEPVTDWACANSWVGSSTCGASCCCPRSRRRRLSRSSTGER